MEDIQPDKNFLVINNRIIEKLSQVRISGNAWRVLMAVIRKTWGYHRKEDWLEYSQLMKVCKMPKARVCEGIKELRNYGIVTQVRNNGKQILAINKHFVVNNSKKVLVGVVTQTRNPTVTQTGTTKDTITKDINTGVSNLKKPMKNYEEPEIQTDPDYKAPEPVKARVPYHEVFEAFGKYPSVWIVNKTQIEAAKSLLKDYGIDKVKTALAFYKENKLDKYCPSVTSPNELANKWESLRLYRDKNNL